MVTRRFSCFISLVGILSLYSTAARATDAANLVNVSRQATTAANTTFVSVARGPASTLDGMGGGNANYAPGFSPDSHGVVWLRMFSHDGVNHFAGDTFTTRDAISGSGS